MTPDDASLIAKMIGTEPKAWLTDATTILFLVMTAGRALHALRSNGGIVGVIRGLIFGTNTPKEKNEN